MITVVHDFETRSAVDIKSCGPWKYAEHESTQVICLAVKVGDKPTRIWYAPWVRDKYDLYGTLDDVQLTWLIERDDVIWEAHNAEFERAIWKHVMPRYGFSSPPLHRFRCSAAKAAIHALPRSLGEACRVLGLSSQKDDEGYKLMLKMCKPRAPRKAERAENPNWRQTLYWYESANMIERLASYCAQDVEAEHALSTALADLPDEEQRIWFLDQEINERGLPIDIKGCQAIIEGVAEYEVALLREFQAITKGVVMSPRQVGAFIEWLTSQGVETADLTKASVRELLSRPDLPAHVRRALEIRQSLGKSSVAKFKAMLDRAQGDGFARSLFMYHGASTGRWSAKAIQPQNMPRDCLTPDETEEAIQLFKDLAFDEIKERWGCPIVTASKCIRGMIKAPEGYEFLCADFSSIEARALAWLAGEDLIVKAFADGLDLYKVTASSIFGVPYDEVTDKQRMVGKVAVLALGYGGGIGAFANMAAAYNLDLEQLPSVVTDITVEEWDQAQFVAFGYLERNPGSMSLEAATVCDVIKRRWRNERPKTVAFWDNLLKAANFALAAPGAVYRYRGLKFLACSDSIGNRWLKCRLPSGRVLYYFKPDYRMVKTPWGEERRQITCMTVDSVSRKWVRRVLNSSILTENVVQAVCRDLLRDAMVRLDETGYTVCFHVHDEVVCLEKKGEKSFDEFLSIVTENPRWAEGLPIGGEGWVGERYQKG